MSKIKQCKFCKSNNVVGLSPTNAFEEILNAIVCKDCGRITTF